MEAITIEREIWIDAPIEKVWEAIVDSERFAQWWGDDYWEFSGMDVGATVKFGDPVEPILAKLSVVDPPKKFQIEWLAQEANHHVTSYTTFSLERVNDGTQVTVNETGFEHVPADVRQKRLDSTGRGYSAVLYRFKSHIVGEIAVEKSIWIDAPIERAWQAITDPAMLTQWYATQFAWDIPTLQKGARVKFHNSESDILNATITVLRPLEQFTLLWDVDAHHGVQLVTSFMLEAENGGTRMTIRETGYEHVPADDRQDWLDATGSGYPLSLENLKALLEGRSLPH